MPSSSSAAAARAVGETGQEGPAGGCTAKAGLPSTEDKAGPDGMALRQARTNRLLFIIAFLVAVLCISMTWKHRARFVRRTSRGVPHAALGGAGVEAGTVPDSVTQFFGLVDKFRCPGERVFTKAEVAKHSSRSDLYIVVDGNVLDVTSFIAYHPGGDVLLDGAGGDDMATVFAQFHDPSSVRLFAAFCVGRMRQD